MISRCSEPLCSRRSKRLPTLAGQCLLRYFTALLATIGVAALISLVFQQQIETPLMLDNSQISAVAVLVPLAAGAAGTINLVQSERSSLVSGTATGMLVAASLAPPAGIISMSMAMGRWDMVVNGVFLLRSRRPHRQKLARPKH